MFNTKNYEPAELLALQELDEVLKALNLSDEDVIEMLLNDLKPYQKNLVQQWYNNFQQNLVLEEADRQYEESF
jgi:hypothetical protein